MGVSLFQRRGKSSAREAKVYVEKAIALEPSNAKFHNSLGCIQEQDGDLQGALDSFRRAALLEPDKVKW